MATRRIKSYAATIDFNNHTIYVRKKLSKPEYVRDYTQSLSPGGVLYAKTEAALLKAIARLYKEHIERCEAMLKTLRKDEIPVVYQRAGHVINLRKVG